MFKPHQHQILSSDGAGLDFDRYDVSNFPYDGSEFQNLDYVVILGVKFNGFGGNFAGYFMKIYYNSTLIFNTGNSTDTKSGNPINWPPPQNTYGTETIGSYNTQVKSAELVSSSSTLLGAHQGFYILPDVHYELIKNGVSIEGNTTIENQIQAGSHFALGSHRGTLKIEGDQIEPSIKSYYGITKLSSPPFIYRNTIAVDDGGVSSGSDQDFNDAVFTLIEGDGFFTGKTVRSSALSEALTSKQYSYPEIGGTNQTWSESTITFVANKTGTFKFKVKRDAGNTNKILIHPGSNTAQGPDGGSVSNASNWAIVTPASGQNSEVTRTLVNLQSGTYEVALRVNNGASNNSRIQVMHIDTNKYPNMF